MSHGLVSRYIRGTTRAIAVSSVSDASDYDDELGGEHGSRIDDGTVCISAVSMPLSASDDREAIWDGGRVEGEDGCGGGG